MRSNDVMVIMRRSQL